MFPLLTKFITLVTLIVPVALVSFVFISSGSRNWVLFLFSEPGDMGLEGGIFPIIVNTVVIVSLATILATVVALATALSFVAYGRQSKFSNLIRGIIEIGASFPRVLYGIAGTIIFCGLAGLGISAASGILTLACMLCPMLITGFVDGLEIQYRACHLTCKTTGLRNRDIWIFYILPAAQPSILTSIQAVVGRGFGDAAALYFTAGTALQLFSGIDHPTATLAVHILVLANDIGGGIQMAFASALVLFGITAAIQLPIIIKQIKIEEN